MPWGTSHVRSWYKNRKGRFTQNWPFTLLEYWTLTRAPDPADYVFTYQLGRTVIPPSTGMTAPVTYAPAREAR